MVPDVEPGEETGDEAEQRPGGELWETAVPELATNTREALAGAITKKEESSREYW